MTLQRAGLSGGINKDCGKCARLTEQSQNRNINEGVLMFNRRQEAGKSTLPPAVGCVQGIPKEGVWHMESNT